MNFEQKLDAVLLEIKNVYNLTDNQIGLLRKNIENRVKLYENVEYKKNSSEVEIIKNTNSIGDMYINRLINNIRNYEFDNNYNINNTDKGNYTNSQQKIYIANKKFISDIAKDKLNNRVSNITEEMLNKATEKVFNHEIGHALQVGFTGTYGNNNDKFNQLILNLSSKFPNDFNRSYSIDEMKTIQTGMIPTRKNDKKEQVRNFYAQNAYTTHLDEIFNDEEALKVTEINKPQLQYEIGQGFTKNIYNYESSNYKITSYATMMKVIMGKQKTFEAMYDDSIVAYEFFDQFKSISDLVYKGSKYEGKAPMLNVLNSLELVKSSNSLQEALKLDLFLTECLKMKILHELKNPNITKDQIKGLEDSINRFKIQMLHNPKIKLQQDVIIEQLQQVINSKKNQMNISVNKADNYNKETQSQIQNTTQVTLSHPKFKELNDLEMMKQEAKKNNDEVAYNYAQQSIKKIIYNNRMQLTTEKYDSLTIKEKKEFIKIKMHESKVLDDKYEFSYWKNNLDNMNKKEFEAARKQDMQYRQSIRQQQLQQYQNNQIQKSGRAL